ncbi:MAG: PD-(D/E)XK nuclease family protein, partial [Planctomycetaceae bacterium]
RYLHLLDSLELWDRQTARLVAIHNQECATDSQLVLLGAVDLNRATRAMLDQVADHVTALVFAPPELADRFDEHGCLQAEAWQDTELPLTTEQIDVVDGPGDQADAVVQALASFDGRYAAEDVTIGVPDRRVLPYLEQRLEECELPVRAGEGTPVRQLDPCQFLDAVAEYLEGRRFRAFADLVRHPAVERWLRGRGVEGDWLSALDRFHAACLPTRLPDDGRSLGRLEAVHAAMTVLLRPLEHDARPLGAWAEPIRNLLVEVYGQRDYDQTDEADRQTIAACDKIHAALKTVSGLDRRVMPNLTGGAAIRLLLQGVSGASVPPPADRAAIELLGWLELPLDDAPALIVTSFNEGFLPAARNADLFLPNELRRSLGMEDNDRRYARDAYATSVLAASRRELRFIVARRTAEGEPMVPSRLLFASDDEELPERTLRFFRPVRTDATHILLPRRLEPGNDVTKLAPAPPRDLPVRPPPLLSMRVTEFRDYLACPYRYYLRHRLGLAGLDDSAVELDPAGFGSLLHGVLNRFGADRSAAGLTDAREITAALDHLLGGLAEETYGDSALPAVRIQIEMVRRRLHAFAAWQAVHRAEGWRIAETEINVADAPFTVISEPMPLRGRIDRIDVNERDGRWILYDYKTGDSGEPPEKTHRKKQQWVDLQLPLYRHLVKAEPLKIAERVEVGYILLPKEIDKTGAVLAEWDETVLADADATAARVIESIREEVFWPPADPPPAFFDDFAAICGSV